MNPLRRTLEAVGVSVLAGGCAGGGCTPIGDNWHLGITVGLVLVAAGICFMIWRDYMGGPARRERRQDRREERKE